jgi:hypothetical protein
MDFEHITNSDHTLLQIVLYNKNITTSPKKALVRRRKSRTIFDLKKMNQEKWIKYIQEIESEFDKLDVIKEIQRARERESRSHKECINYFQRIWDSIENAIKRTGRKIIPLKKISHINKPILKNKGHTTSFKDLREITTVLLLVKKLQRTQNPDSLEKINLKINTLAKKYLLLIHKNFCNSFNTTSIPWEEWMANIKENIKAIKIVNYREEAIIKEKEIKEAIQKRYKNLEENQKRMINSLTNMKKGTITLDRILVKNQQSPYTLSGQKYRTL